MRISFRASLFACAVSLLATLTTQALADTKIRKSSFGYDDQGAVIRETIEPDVPDSCMRTNYTLDAAGNRTGQVVATCTGASGPSTWSASSRTSSTTYTTDGYFPSTSTNALGHTETRMFTPNGDLASLVGPNGLTTSWEYDGFGRKTKESRADGTYTTWAYVRCPNAGANCPEPIGGVNSMWVLIERHFRTTGSTNWPEQRKYFDTLNRVLRVQKEGFTDPTTGVLPLWVQDTEYDSIGRVKRKSNSYDPAQSSPIWTEIAYDALGRVVEERRSDAAATGGVAITTYQYNGLTTLVTNPKGQTQTTVKNEQGQTSRIVDAETNTVQYTYDAEGVLLRTDAGGSVTTLTYDLRGNKVAMVDPTMGSWTYAYNAFGNLVQQTDSQNRVTTIAYDKLARMTKRTEPDLVSEWSYDKMFDGSACGKSVGSLCEAKADNGYRRVNTYDSLARLKSTANSLDNSPTLATVSVGYASDSGRIITRTWPTGFQATYTYNSRGYPREVTAGGTSAFPQTLSMTIDAMDASGHVTSYRQGGQAINTTKVFDQATGRFTSQTVTKGGAGPGSILAHSYTYDALDNMTVRQDSTLGVGTTESFSYDSLNRLKQYLILGGGVSPPRSTSVLYDARGNITYKSDVGQYNYDSIRPNRLQSISLTTPAGVPPNIGTRALAFSFDDANGQIVNGVATGNGNVTETISQDTVNSRFTYRRQSYTSFNMPLVTTFGNLVNGTPGAIERKLSFTYGPEHQRIRQQVELGAGAPSAFRASTVWYLNGDDSLGLTYEKEIFTSGLTEHRHFLAMGSLVFAVQISRTGSLGGAPPTAARYFHHDHLGSIAVVSDESGAVLERLAFDPWGKRRLPDGNADPLDTVVGQNTSRGFSMHEHLDEVGTIHMNGRIYDPLIGRFLSADPYIQNPRNLQSYNRYSYVLNNPLAYHDPTGNFSLKRLVRGIVGAVIGYFTGNWFGSWFQTGSFASASFTGFTANSLSASIVAGASGGFTGGVISSGTLKGGLYGALSAGLFRGVGDLNLSLPDAIVAHAAVGCVTQSIAGGSCKAGALSAGFAKWATVGTPDLGSVFANGVKATVIGGTASVLGGGKFEDGAITSAYGYAFNCVAHQCTSEAYDPNDSRTHVSAAQTTGTICNVARAGCLDAMENVLGCDSAPGQGGCTGVGEEKSWQLNGMTSGNPITQYRPSAHMIINGTSPGHVLDDGYVVRWIAVDSLGNASIWSFGYGTSIKPGMDGVLTRYFNQTVGPSLFNDIGVRNRVSVQCQLQMRSAGCGGG